MRLKYLPSEGTRIVELGDGATTVYFDGGDTYDFEDEELAQKLLLDGTFEVVFDEDYPEELLEKEEEMAEDTEADSAEDGPAAEDSIED
jgi:hypothetical protein